MRSERKTGLRRGVEAGLYGAAVTFLTLLPQAPDPSLYVSVVGLAFLAPFSYLAVRGDQDARRSDRENSDG